MHAIAKHWPQLKKQVEKSQTRNDWVIYFHSRVVDSTQLECSKSVIIQQ